MRDYVRFMSKGSIEFFELVAEMRRRQRFGIDAKALEIQVDNRIKAGMPHIAEAKKRLMEKEMKLTLLMELKRRLDNESK